MELFNIIFVVLITSLGFYLAHKNMLFEALTVRQNIIMFILYVIGAIFMAVWGNIGIVIQIVCITVFLYVISSSFLLNLSGFLGSYLICVLCDNVVSTFLVQYILGLSNQQLQQNRMYFSIYSVCMLFVFFGVTYIIGRFIIRLVENRSSGSADKEFWGLVAVNLSCCTAVFIFNIYFGEQAGYTDQIVLFNCVLFGIYFLISNISIISLFKSFKIRAEAETKQLLFDRLQEYTQNIEKMYSDLRFFKHDYVNIMISLVGYIESNDMEGLSDYFTNSIAPLGKKIEAGDYKLSRLMNIHIVELKSIVSAKIIQAHEKGIEIEIEILEVIDRIDVDLVDLTRLIGIYLDNAIEACMETEMPQLAFIMIKNEDSVAIFIKNNYNIEQIELQNLNKLSFSTKGEGRGIGLYNASNIINKYDNIFLETSVKNRYFIQYLEINHLY